MFVIALIDVEFYLVPASLTRFIVNNEFADTSFRNYWWSMYGEKGVVFRVKACREVHVVVGAVPGNPDLGAYEVILGENSNAGARIVDRVGGGTMDVSPFCRFVVKKKPGFRGEQNLS